MITAIQATRSWKKKREGEREIEVWHGVNVYRPRKFCWISMNAAATASESNRVVLPCFPFHPHQPTFSSRVQETASIDIDPSPSISTRSYRNTARVTTEYLFAKHTYIYTSFICYSSLEISSTQFDKFNAKSWPSPSRTEDGLTEGDLRMDKQRNGGDRWLVILIRWRLKRRRGFSDPWRVWFDIYTTSTVSIQLNNELLISRAKGALPRAFPRNPSIGKVSRTRRVGVSEIGCNTKPLQTVRAHGHLFHPRVLLPLRRQEFLISTTILLGGYYTLCLLSRNTRDSLSLSLSLTRTFREEKSEKQSLSILFSSFYEFFTSVETRNFKETEPSLRRERVEEGTSETLTRLIFGEDD